MMVNVPNFKQLFLSCKTTFSLFPWPIRRLSYLMRGKVEEMQSEKKRTKFGSRSTVGELLKVVNPLYDTHL